MKKKIQLLNKYDIIIEELRFIWDPRKNNLNIKKHNVSFQEASTVFEDLYARITYDKKHSIYEDRFLIIGLSNHNHVLVVSHTYSDDDLEIRIISARKATKKEEAYYFNEKEQIN